MSPWLCFVLAGWLAAPGSPAAKQTFLDVMKDERDCSHTAALAVWPTVPVDVEVAYAAMGPCVVPEIINDLVHKYPVQLAAAIRKNVAFGYSNVLQTAPHGADHMHALFLFGFRLSFSVDYITMGCEEDIAPLCTLKDSTRAFLKECVALDKCVAQLLKDLK